MNFATYTSLEDSTNYITGGTSSIGTEIVHAFADQRSCVGFLDFGADAGCASLTASLSFSRLDVIACRSSSADAMREVSSGLGLSKRGALNRVRFSTNLRNRAGTAMNASKTPTLAAASPAATRPPPTLASPVPSHFQLRGVRRH